MRSFGRSRGRALRGGVGVLAVAALAVGLTLSASAVPLRRFHNFSLTPSANDPTKSNYLNAISCAVPPVTVTTTTSPVTCMAVGVRYVNKVGRAFSERLANGHWTILATPSASAGQNLLTAVSCPTVTSCFAVGGQAAGNVDSTLVERWNGRRWSIQHSPNVGTKSGDLYGVDCRSATWCTAVGRFETPGQRTLVEVWRGTSWQLVQSPNQGTNDNFLNAVACPTMTRCFAVGFTYNDAGTETRTLVERWSGHGWVIVPTPNRGSLNNTLYGIACLSPTRCRADGYSKVGSSNVTLLERWNGAGWGIVGTPNVAGSQNAVIEGMSCAGGMLCVATGVTTHGSSGRSLVEEAVGDGPWAIVPSANVAGAANEVIGVSCPWAAQCFAADQVSTPSRGLVGILESR